MCLIIGPLVIYRTPTDVFPDINIPVVSVIWGYTGLSADEIASRIVVGYERGLTATVNDIEHIESQSLNGLGVVKIYFHPNVRLEMAVAQVTALSQSAVRNDPPGTTPPFIITYDASSVPILQLALSGKNLSEQQLNDIGSNFIRSQLATVQGAVLPNPYGGKQRQVQVDLNMEALQAKGLSPNDVVSAIGSQNLILPSGTVKIGALENDVELNSSPRTVEELNDLPIKAVGTNTIYIRDVAHVRDGSPPQTNVVHVDGQRAALMTVLKSGNASTLDVIAKVKDAMPLVLASLPPELQVRPIADQSLFVRASINGVLREAIIAACLTGIMILVFLGNSQRDRGNHQYHDAGRPGAGGWYSGRRCHCRNRKHQSQSRAGQGNHSGHPGRGATDRRSRVRVHAFHLYCFCSHVFSYWRGPLPVCAARRSSRFRDARFLFAFANAGADHGAFSAESP